ncbi:hypothetical protein B0A55_04331 [Friedmanniomyces simplex]|uniref:Nudix hydrolase domain-containing protein n=1 Tax=Friedmanniomyces simplex TaxID=329884 RepID=A0A4V5NH35_9PEZI|nr:hypothetical protein B0A55_04331 [Friedmanniomyces simplex]
MAQPSGQHSYLSLVASCDDFPFDPAGTEEYYKLYLPNDDQPHGFMLPAIVKQMPWTSDFAICHDHPRSVIVLDRSNSKDPASAINAAFAQLVNECIERKLFDLLCGRHSEPFAIVGARYDQPVHVERFAAALFGLTQRGAHLVAYTMDPDAGMKFWIPRRSAHLYTYPAHEEASLPEMLVREHARSGGAISHISLTGKGFPGEQGLVVPDYIYVYDMELPPDVVPKPHDDEVGEFYCLSVEEVQAALLREEFKPDSAAVLVDFLIRHSIIIPENEPDFVEISMRLHRRLPFEVGV